MMVMGLQELEPQAPRYSGRQLTRVSKIDVFPQLVPFAKRPNRIGFSNIQMPVGSFLDAVRKNNVRFSFRDISF